VAIVKFAGFVVWPGELQVDWDGMRLTDVLLVVVSRWRLMGACVSLGRERRGEAGCSALLNFADLFYIIVLNLRDVNESITQVLGSDFDAS
jgi:hypothetical protein